MKLKLDINKKKSFATLIGTAVLGSILFSTLKQNPHMPSFSGSTSSERITATNPSLNYFQAGSSGFRVISTTYDDVRTGFQGTDRQNFALQVTSSPQTQKNLNAFVGVWEIHSDSVPTRYLVIEKDLSQPRLILREGNQTIGRAIWQGVYKPTSIKKNILKGQMTVIAIGTGTQTKDIPIKLEVSSNGKKLTYTYQGSDSSGPQIYIRSSKDVARKVKKILSHRSYKCYCPVIDGGFYETKTSDISSQACAVGKTWSTESEARQNGSEWTCKLQ